MTGGEVERFQKRMILTPLEGIPLINAGDPLPDIILEALRKMGLRLEDGDILVLAQKIVSKAEGRQVDLRTVSPSMEALNLGEETAKDPRVVELILQESKSIIRTRPGLIIAEHRLGFICANAGIDHSNVDPQDGDTADWVLLLPENPDQSAQRIQLALREKTGVQVGVLVIDSHGRAWRLGTVGVMIGTAGVPALVDMRGEADLFDYRLRVTQIGAGDELAAGASLMMGQAAEGLPVIHVRGFPYPPRASCLPEIIRPEKEDLFR